MFGGFLDAAVVLELLFGANNIMLEQCAKLRSAQDEVRLPPHLQTHFNVQLKVLVSPQLKVF